MTKPTVGSVIADLVAEQQALDAVVAKLDDAQWELSTPSPRWAVRDQIGHLAFFDETAALAITGCDGAKDGDTGSTVDNDGGAGTDGGGSTDNGGTGTDNGGGSTGTDNGSGR